MRIAVLSTIADGGAGIAAQYGKVSVRAANADFPLKQAEPCRALRLAEEKVQKFPQDNKTVFFGNFSWVKGNITESAFFLTPTP
jgi:hypothetical protein